MTPPPDATGRPTSTIVIKFPDGRTREFTGNVWEIMVQEANATFLSCTTYPKMEPS